MTTKREAHTYSFSFYRSLIPVFARWKYFFKLFFGWLAGFFCFSFEAAHTQHTHAFTTSFVVASSFHLLARATRKRNSPHMNMETTSNRSCVRFFHSLSFSCLFLSYIMNVELSFFACLYLVCALQHFLCSAPFVL